MSAFVASLAEMTIGNGRKRLHETVDDLMVTTVQLTHRVEAFKARKEFLAGDLNRQPSAERRVEAMTPEGVRECATDQIRVIDAADEIIRQAHRLKALAQQDLCEDWTETALRASACELNGGVDAA